MSILLPLLMLNLVSRWCFFMWIFNGLAILAAFAFGNISFAYVYDIIQHHQVFMTKIHAIFLNTWFLGSGVYLGLYVMYLLFRLFVIEKTTDDHR
jgi:hypothetical protein